MKKPCWPAFLVLVLFAAPVAGQVKLEWQFKEGATFFAERAYTQKQTVEIKSKVFKEERRRTWLTAVTVKEKTAAGYVLDLQVESVTFQTAGAPTSAGLDDKMTARMKGCRFTATVTPQGRLVKLDGYADFIAKLAEKNGDIDRVLRVLLSEEAVREDIEEIFGFLPEKAVTKGDKWRRETVEPVPPFGSFKSAIDYVLDKDDGDEIAIGYTIKMTYKPPTSDGDLFRVVKGGLRGEEGKGSIVFDAKKGTLLRSEKSMTIQGELLIESMGRQTQMEFTSTNTLRVRVFEKKE